MSGTNQSLLGLYCAKSFTQAQVKEIFSDFFQISLYSANEYSSYHHNILQLNHGQHHSRPEAPSHLSIRSVCCQGYYQIFVLRRTEEMSVKLDCSQCPPQQCYFALQEGTLSDNNEVSTFYQMVSRRYLTEGCIFIKITRNIHRSIYNQRLMRCGVKKG